MPYCRKCGKPVNESDLYCSACGSKTEPDINEKASSAFNNFTEKVSDFNNTEDSTNSFNEQDIKDNKVLSVFAYLGILVLIPIFGASESPFARFHANQGLVLLIAEIAYGILNAVVSGISVALLGILGMLVSAILNILNLAFLALIIIGIINVINGKAKQLPVIGGITLFK